VIILHSRLLARLVGEDATQSVFDSGEQITIIDPFGNTVGNVTTSTLSDYQGKSKGVGITDGVIFQKGHFLYVEPQTLIVSKYDENANDVAVGFSVFESIVNANQDETLLDNAQGYPNKNAPGADRLKLRPLLTSYAKDEEPEGFFALIRYKQGNAVTIRDATEFNSIEKEMASRTYDQSGNYVSKGLEVSIEEDVNDSDILYAAVAPGIGYSHGFETNNFSTRFFQIDPVETIESSQNQQIGIKYGNYLPVQPSNLTRQFDNSGATKYKLFTSGGAEIGDCHVRSVETDKIYIYNIRKALGQESVTIGKIGTTSVDAVTVDGGVQGTKYSPMVFRIGGNGIKDVTDITITKRRALELAGAGETSEILIPFEANRYPIDNTNIVVINQINQQVGITSKSVLVDGNGNSTYLRLIVDGTIVPDGTIVYYDEVKSSAIPNFKSSVNMYVKTNLSTFYRRASLGVPDAYELISVKLFNGATSTEISDVTEKFKLGTNQKDGFYDLSYVELRAGESIEFGPNEVLLVNFKVYKPDTTSGDGFYVANSYINVPREEIPVFSGSNGLAYDLTSCVDFRPHIAPNVQYRTEVAGSGVAFDYNETYNYTTTPKNVLTSILSVPATDTSITADIESYLSRVDQIVIESGGELSYRKGKEAKVPYATSTSDLVLAEVYVPSNPVRLRGPYAPRLKNTSIKAYTMEDISKIDKQLNRLTEISSLSMLKSDADDLLITDSAGNNRFKNGIVVDNFVALKIADITNPEFFAGVDKFRERLIPAVKQFPVKLKLDTLTNAKEFGEIITKEVNPTPVTVLSQPFATTYRNAVQGTFKYNGSGELFPPYDSGYDVTHTPVPAVIDVDIEGPITDLANRVNEMLKITGANRTVVEVGRSTRLERTAGGRNEITTVRTNTKEYGVTTNVKETTQKVGEFVRNAAFLPFMERKAVRILVYGLRPSTRHYFYFDEDPVSSMVSPGVIANPFGRAARAKDVRNKSQYGQPVFTDENGVLAAVFMIPAATYIVGERSLEITDVDDYNAIDSAQSSYIALKYSAYNFDVEKQALTVNTRSATSDVVVTRDVTTGRDFISRFIPDPPRRNRDPLAQTFYVRRNAVNGSKFFYLDSVDIFFKSQTPGVGVTVEIREVINGYPSRVVVPFGKKHLTATTIPELGVGLDNEIITSDNGSVATKFKFDNPVRLHSEREYAFVVAPDGGDPGFNLYVAKLGERDLNTNRSINQDWGDGVLFSSTNNRTWIAHADQDLKFNLNIYNFSTEPSSVKIKADDVEFLGITGTTGEFLSDEIAYAEIPNSSVAVGIFANSPDTVQTSDGSEMQIEVGQYAILESDADGSIFASKVKAITNVQSNDTLVLEEPSPFAGAATLKIGVGGFVSLFDASRPDSIHLYRSTAKAEARFEIGLTVKGVDSGAFGTITSVDDIALSSIQAHMYKVDSPNASVDFALYNASEFDRNLPTNDDLYMLNKPRFIASKSNIVTSASPDNFVINCDMRSDNEFSTPIFDFDISQIHAYRYYVTNNEDTTSKYVSKEITLNSDLAAEGLSFFAGIHRPQGSEVKVYARFKYKNNIENLSDWIELENDSPELYSDSSELEDYRDFEYHLPSQYESEYASFQLKIVLLSDGVANPPALTDYRAIAVT